MTRKEFARLLRRQFRRRYGYLNPLPEDADVLLDAVEARIGFALPPIVRFIYKYAGEDFLSPEWSAEQYLKWRADPSWPDRMVPLQEEGCGIWLCLDCSRKSAPVVCWRGDLEEPDSIERIFEHLTPSFPEWLRGQLSREDGGYA